MSFPRLAAKAPAKINLGLFVGPTRADGRHELVSVMQSISLCDELTLVPAQPGAQADELICSGVDGPPEENLALRALAAFRAASGWNALPVSLQVRKRVPVAAGLGGGSADAAAALRLAAAASGLGDERLLLELAADLGADVPAQVRPGCWLAEGVGERLQPLPGIPSFGVLVLPSRKPLSTAAVYRELDRVGPLREPDELRCLARELRKAFAGASGEALASGHDDLPAGSHDDLPAGGHDDLPAGGHDDLPAGSHDDLPAGSPAAFGDIFDLAGFELFHNATTRNGLLHNDLQAAAMRLDPTIEQALQEARDVGADVSLLSGSGPTVLGLFGGADGPDRAGRAATALKGRTPAALAAVPVFADLAK